MKKRAGGTSKKSSMSPSVEIPEGQLPSDCNWEYWRRRPLWPLRLAVWLTTGRALEDTEDGNEPQDWLYDIAGAAMGVGDLAAYVDSELAGQTKEVTYQHSVEGQDLRTLPPEKVKYEPVTMSVPVDSREVKPAEWVEFLKEKEWPYPNEFNKLLKSESEKTRAREAVVEVIYAMIQTLDDEELRRQCKNENGKLVAAKLVKCIQENVTDYWPSQITPPMVTDTMNRIASTVIRFWENERPGK